MRGSQVGTEDGKGLWRNSVVVSCERYITAAPGESDHVRIGVMPWIFRRIGVEFSEFPGQLIPLLLGAICGVLRPVYHWVLHVRKRPSWRHAQFIPRYPRGCRLRGSCCTPSRSVSPRLLGVQDFLASTRSINHCAIFALFESEAIPTIFCQRAGMSPCFNFNHSLGM